MRELAEVDAEAEEEGLPKVSARAKSEARRILAQLSRSMLIEPTIYPTLDGEIAIQFNAPSRARAVVIELGSDWEATCFASIDGLNRRVRFDDSLDSPGDFVEAQLN